MPRTYRYVERFDLNHKGVERIATGPGCRVAVRTIAEDAKEYAVKISPYDDGVYRLSFAVKLHIRRDWPWGSEYQAARVCADLINAHPAAIMIEKGSNHTRRDGSKYRIEGHQVLTRTLEHLAVDGKPSPRRRKRRP